MLLWTTMFLANCTWEEQKNFTNYKVFEFWGRTFFTQYFSNILGKSKLTETMKCSWPSYTWERKKSIQNLRRRIEASRRALTSYRHANLLARHSARKYLFSSLVREQKQFSTKIPVIIEKIRRLIGKSRRDVVLISLNREGKSRFFF